MWRLLSSIALFYFCFEVSWQTFKFKKQSGNRHLDESNFVTHTFSVKWKMALRPGEIRRYGNSWIKG